MAGYAEAYKSASRKGGTTEIGVTYVKWEKVGQSIVGLFIDKNEVPGRFQGQVYNQYLFETDDGPIKFHIGAAADRDIGKIMVPGEIYVIRYDGQESIGNSQRVNRFHVEHIDKAFAMSEELPAE